jgi:hypothetical protein
MGPWLEMRSTLRAQPAPGTGPSSGASIGTSNAAIIVDQQTGINAGIARRIIPMLCDESTGEQGTGKPARFMYRGLYHLSFADGETSEVLLKR